MRAKGDLGYNSKLTEVKQTFKLCSVLHINKRFTNVLWTGI